MTHVAVMLKRVLVVDDDPSVRAGLPRILASAEVEVATAGDVEEATAILAAQTFDLVLCDLCLSGIDDRGGFELLSWIHARHPRTPVLLLTAFGSAEVRAEALLRGAADYWEKRGRIEDLVDKVRALGIAVRGR